MNTAVTDMHKEDGLVAGGQKVGWLRATDSPPAARAGKKKGRGKISTLRLLLGNSDGCNARRSRHMWRPNNRRHRRWRGPSKCNKEQHAQQAQQAKRAQGPLAACLRAPSLGSVSAVRLVNSRVPTLPPLFPLGTPATCLSLVEVLARPEAVAAASHPLADHRHHRRTAPERRVAQYLHPPPLCPQPLALRQGGRGGRSSASAQTCTSARWRGGSSQRRCSTAARVVTMGCTSMLCFGCLRASPRGPRHVRLPSLTPLLPAHPPA